MKRKCFQKLYILVLVITLLLTGCKNNNKDNSLDAVNSDVLVDYSQKLNVVLDLEPSTLDPSKGTDLYSYTVLINVLEPLTRLEEDANLNNTLAPAGAESWEVNEDGTVWTFKIRDAKWSDGVPVTAYHYEYGIKRSINHETASPYAYLLEPIKNALEVNAGEIPLDQLGVKVLDEKTLQITLESPTPYFLDLTYQGVMLPQREDLVNTHGDKYGTELDTLVYNGPFVLTSWIHNSELILEKNLEYWDKKSVRLEKINMFIIQDENAIFNSFINGAIEVVSTYKAEWRDEFIKYDNLKHFEIVEPSTNFLFFNTNDNLFSNVNVRKAFLLAIDREDMSNVIYSGVNKPAFGFVSPSVSAGKEEYRETAESPISKLYDEKHDPKALLAKGLKELGIYTNPSKIKVEISLGSTDQRTRTIAEYLQQTYIKELGIDFEINQMEWPLFASLLDKGDFQLGSVGWNADFNDPISFLSLFKSNAGILNNGWGNTEYDKYLDLTDKEMDHTKRLEYFEKCENILLYDEAVIIPLTYRTKNVFMYDYVNYPGITPFGSVGYKYTYID